MRIASVENSGPPAPGGPLFLFQERQWLGELFGKLPVMGKQNMAGLPARKRF
jgi:hypothetical protein